MMARIRYSLYISISITLKLLPAPLDSKSYLHLCTTFGFDINFYDSCQKKFVDIANCNLKEKLFLKVASTVQTKYENKIYKFSIKCVLEKYRPCPI